MSSVKKQAKILRTDGKEQRADFMLGNGKGFPKDNLTRQVPSRGKDLTPIQCEDLYKTNSMAKNIIDIPAEDLTRSGWTLKMKDEKLKALYESKLRQLKAKERFEKLFVYERLYGDGFIAIGTTENKNYDLSMQLIPQNIKTIPYINTFSSKKVSNRIVNENVFSPQFGQIEMFEISNNASSGSRIELTTTSGAVKVHRSRIIHQQNLRFEDDLEGTSLFENLYDILTVVDTSVWSVGQILYDYIFKVYKSKDVDSLTAEEKTLIEMKADYRFRTEALALIHTDEELKKEASQISGIGELLNFVWDYLSGSAKMPKTVLKGQESGTISGAQYDVMNYYARIAAIQENQLRPHLEYLVRLLMWAEDECGGRIDPDTVEWSIEFNPLWSVDSKTDAEIRKLTAETDSIYLLNGVIDPDEVKEARFARFGVTETSKFNADSADDEDIDKLADEVYKSFKNGE